MLKIAAAWRARRSARLKPGMLLMALSTAVSACTTGADVGLVPSGLNCVDDSPACVSARSSALKHMKADKSRSWIHRPATPASYASGVRLFALKSRKKELTCQELAIGRREAQAGPNVLRGPAGKGLTPAQISRGVILAQEVSHELDREFKRRGCRA
ncbi:MAG: hypothetical protein AB7G35_02960 [Hyphomicrobiaceae bacterium]